MESPDVVVVVLDTMRRSVLRMYGGEAGAPTLEALASQGVVYENCIASSPWTVPSHASLFTGLLPSRHGVHETWDRKMGQVFGMMANVDTETLPSYLSSRGYATACYSANANIAVGSGFEKGFDSFSLMNIADPDEKTKDMVELARKYGGTRKQAAWNLLRHGKVGDLARLYREDRKLRRYHKERNFPLFKGGDAIASSISGLKLERPFFLFVNLLEMHEPYISGEAGAEPRPSVDLYGKRVVGPKLMASIRRKYAEEVGVVDSFVGKVVQWLKATGAYEGAMVIATSDHGQALKEAGFYGHGAYMYDEILEVPLIVKYPRGTRPPPAPGYQPLHRVQEVVKDWLAGVKDGASLSSGHAVAEGFGVHFGTRNVKDAPDFESKRELFDRPRKAVYMGGMKLALDGKDGSVLEFKKGGERASPSEMKEEFARMVGVIADLRDEGFALPR